MSRVPLSQPAARRLSRAARARKQAAQVLAIGALAAASPLAAQTTMSASPQTSFGQTAAPSAANSGWRFSLTPYVWLPTINARIDYPVSALPSLPSLPNGPGNGGSGGGGAGGGSGGNSGTLLDGVLESEIGPNKYLTKLNFALMLNGEARHGPWLIMGDFIGIKASGMASAVTGFTPTLGVLPPGALGATANLGTETSISTTLLTVMGGYQWVATPVLHLDVLGGVRAGRLSSTIDWTLGAQFTLPNNTPVLSKTGTAEVSRNPVDAVVGIKGRYMLSEHWSLPFYLDVGAGTSQLTWQAFAGASYAFSWGNVVLAYRHLYMQNESRDVFKRFTLSGPMVGASFHF